ncbi:hypothetical protein [Natronococcus roseus]|uniref:hypothetical protein n=1 Tax=Natronococcus roseus TaxID=1052014 RepID=UPI00374CDEC5
MNRRQGLRSLGVALSVTLAGCVSESGSTDDGNGSDGDTNGDSAVSTDGFERQISISDVDDVPSDAPVEFDVEVVEKTVTADETGFIEVFATNTGDTEKQIWSPYYKGSSSAESEAGILLYSLTAPDSPEEDYTPDCIEDPEATDEYVEMTDEGPLNHTLGPNETGTDRLIVVDDPTAEGCFPTGEYRFENAHEYAGIEFTWGFTLRITDENTNS